jgi:hypothetical protein
MIEKKYSLMGELIHYAAIGTTTAKGFTGIKIESEKGIYYQKYLLNDVEVFKTLCGAFLASYNFGLLTGAMNTVQYNLLRNCLNELKDNCYAEINAQTYTKCWYYTPGNFYEDQMISKDSCANVTMYKPLGVLYA